MAFTLGRAPRHFGLNASSLSVFFFLAALSFYLLYLFFHLVARLGDLDSAWRQRLGEENLRRCLLVHILLRVRHRFHLHLLHSDDIISGKKGTIILHEKIILDSALLEEGPPRCAPPNPLAAIPLEAQKHVNHVHEFDGDNDDDDDDCDDDDNNDDGDNLVRKFHAWTPPKQAGHSCDDCALLSQRFRCGTEDDIYDENWSTNFGTDFGTNG